MSLEGVRLRTALMLLVAVSMVAGVHHGGTLRHSNSTTATTSLSCSDPTQTHSMTQTLTSSISGTNSNTKTPPPTHSSTATTTVSFSNSVSDDSMTVTPPPTATVTSSPSTSGTKSSSLSETWSTTETMTPTQSLSGSLTGSASTTLTTTLFRPRTKTQYKHHTRSKSRGRSQSQSVSQSFSESAGSGSSTRTGTVTPAPTSTTSSTISATESWSVSQSRTRTPAATRSGTSTMTKYKQQTRSKSRGMSRSQSVSQSFSASDSGSFTSTGSWTASESFSSTLTTSQYKHHTRSKSRGMSQSQSVSLSFSESAGSGSSTRTGTVTPAPTFTTSSTISMTESLSFSRTQTRTPPATASETSTVTLTDSFSLTQTGSISSTLTATKYKRHTRSKSRAMSQSQSVSQSFSDTAGSGSYTTTATVTPAPTFTTSSTMSATESWSSSQSRTRTPPETVSSSSTVSSTASFSLTPTGSRTPPPTTTPTPTPTPPPTATNYKHRSPTKYKGMSKTPSATETRTVSTSWSFSVSQSITDATISATRSATISTTFHGTVTPTATQSATTTVIEKKKSQTKTKTTSPLTSSSSATHSSSATVSQTLSLESESRSGSPESISQTFTETLSVESLSVTADTFSASPTFAGRGSRTPSVTPSHSDRRRSLTRSRSRSSAFRSSPRVRTVSSYFNQTTTRSSTTSSSTSSTSSTTVTPTPPPPPPLPITGGQLELLRGNTIAMDSLLEIPQAYSNNPGRVLTEEVRQTLRFARIRYLSIRNDTMDLSVIGLNRSFTFMLYQATTNATSATIEVVDATGCIKLSGGKEELLSYVSSNATFTAVTPARIQVEFQPIPINNSVSMDVEELMKMSTDEVLTMSILPPCVTSRQPMNAVNLRFMHMDRPRPTPAVVSAQTALLVTQFLVAAGSGGIVAVSGARSTAVLGLFTCLPEFDEELGPMDNPFRQRFSTDQDGQFLAASVMNHLLIIGLPLLHALFGWTYAQIQKVSTSEGFAWAKFPSLSLIPLQFLVEATCSSSVIVLIYATEPSHRLAAAVSLFVAALNPDIEKFKAKAEVGTCKVKIVDPFAEVAPHDPFDAGKPRSLLEGFKFRLKWVLYFLDSDSKWVDADPDDRKGYTRANEMLFGDYNGPNYWFMGVEVGVAAVMGALEGIKLGPEKCTPVSVTILIVLILFLILMMLRMPYHTLLDSYFNVLVTIIQVTGAIYATVGLAAQQTDPYKDRSELLAMIGLYLLVGKAIIDMLMKAKELLEALRGFLESRKVEDDEQHSLLQNGNLTERLLDTLQEQDGDQQMARRTSSSLLLLVPEGQRSPSVVLSRHPSVRSPLLSPPKTPSKWELEWDPSEFVSLELPSRLIDIEKTDERDLLRHQYRAPRGESHRQNDDLPAGRGDDQDPRPEAVNVDHLPLPVLEFQNSMSEEIQLKIGRQQSEIAQRLRQEAEAKRKAEIEALLNSLDNVL